MMRIRTNEEFLKITYRETQMNKQTYVQRIMWGAIMMVFTNSPFEKLHLELCKCFLLSSLLHLWDMEVLVTSSTLMTPIVFSP